MGGSDQLESLATPEERLRQAHVMLPPANRPVGSYEMARRVGGMLYVSGHGAFEAGAPLHTGKLGDTLTTEQGADAAREVMLHLLSTVKAELGELSRVGGFAKVVVWVNSTPDFTEQHLVANGATDLLVEVFGEVRGRTARTAIGVASLPLGFAVEIEALVHLAGEG